MSTESINKKDLQRVANIASKREREISQIFNQDIQIIEKGNVVEIDSKGNRTVIRKTSRSRKIDDFKVMKGMKITIK